MLEALETEIEGILINGVHIIKFSGSDASSERARSINRQLVSLRDKWVSVVASCFWRRTMDHAASGSRLNQFATRYTAAWCSQHAASVASFFAEQGSLKINDGAPAIGRDAITSSAQGVSGFEEWRFDPESTERRRKKPISMGRCYPQVTAQAIMRRQPSVMTPWKHIDID
jgi:hypothetical protein